MSELILIAGVDEVGRGPLAGPVVAAAVIFDPKQPRINGIRDSKQLTAEKREYLAEKIKERALAWAIGRAEHSEIDAINIFQASLLAMQRAVAALTIKPNKILVDGMHIPVWDYDSEAIIAGDATIKEISAASIIAKVARDAEMKEMDKLYPGYGFANHVGYSTEEHIIALEKLGPCPIHRRSFTRVQSWISNNASEI